MSSHGARHSALRIVALVFALLLVLPAGYAVFSAVSGAHNSPAPRKRPPLTPHERSVFAAYLARLSEWQRARGPYDAKAAAYWTAVNEKRLARRDKRTRGQPVVLTDYVLEQPPVYSGPARPSPPSFLQQAGNGASSTPEREVVPVVADFLRSAAEHYKFVPERPAAEIDFKRVYARAAVAAGIGKEQAVRIFAFEAGGNGRHDVQAGLEIAGKGRAITTALGYNQLLATNTVGLLAEHGEQFTEALAKLADGATPERRKRLNDKLAALRKMITFARTVPNQWTEHDKLARTEKGFGLHALILDMDMGPMIQTQKLLNSMNFAKKKGITTTLSAAELEMMNLMGDGSGLDVLLLTPEMREKVPTSNFFQRGGYERNPIVAKYNVAAKLIAITNTRMDTLAAMPGAKELEAEIDAAAKAVASNTNAITITTESAATSAAAKPLPANAGVTGR